MKTSLLRHRGLRTGLGVVAVLLVGWFGGRSFAVPAGPDDDTASAAAPDHDDSDAGPTTTGSPDAPPPPSGSGSAEPGDDGSGPVPPAPAPDPPIEGGDTGPDDTSPPPTTEATTTTTIEVDPVPDDDYKWELPMGDIDVTMPEGPLYGILKSGRCQAAQDFLDETWSGLQSPRTVLLYQAAIHFCRGKREMGEQLFDRAAIDGWGGIHHPFIDCQIYATVRSVLEQVAPESIYCPGGPPPPWPETRVDPRDSS